MEIKSCPFALSFSDPLDRECIGEDCINFEWVYTTPPGWRFNTGKTSEKYGLCNYFKQGTGHRSE